MLVIPLFSALENYTETRWKATETTTKSSTIKGDDNIVDENRSSQSSHHTARESNHMIVDGLSRTEGSREADISDQTLIATGIDEGPWRLARSDTILSIEERSLGSSTHQRPRSSQNEIEHADKGQGDGILAEDSLEPPSLPAHERNYYIDRWYIGLAIFNFGQAMLLSGVFLSTKETSGLIMYPENFLFFFTNQVNWILVYAPLSSFAITLSNVCLHATQRRLGERPTWWSRCTNANWLQLILEVVLLCGGGTFSIMTSTGFPVYWDPIFAGHLLVVLIIALLMVICLPWSWVTSRKLKRESRA